ncbi:MAG: imidazolonepropionase [Myxococcales bacterium]|nr:imidazolonepropionase [Myxococcales bacterium]
MSGAPDCLVLGARQVITCASAAERARAEVGEPGGISAARGNAQGELGTLENTGIALSGGIIQAIAPSAELAARFPEARVVDAQGALILPGFVDCHTHLLFAGNRAEEWEQRMGGASYLEILKQGGGIRRTMAHTRAATREELKSHARLWLRRMLEQGTVHVEAKTGYRLDHDGELEMLRLHRELAAEGPQGITSTYLGAHVVPPEHREQREVYLALVDETLRQAAAEGLCDFVDVFCEDEAFSLAETRHILELARSFGLGLKLHTEQFTSSGGTLLGAELGATSVDHLEVATPEDIKSLAAGENPPICVLLPGVAFHLRLETHAPGRALVDAGVPVALATDFNPGSSPTPSMPLMIALAARTQGLSVAEAIVAATRNAACAVGRGDALGTIEVGKRCDVQLVDAPDYRYLGYTFGYSPVRQVLIAGEPQL